MGNAKQLIQSKEKPEQLQKYLYQELLRITSMLDDNVSEPQIFGLMSVLVKKARYQVNAESDMERLMQLFHLVYHEWQFSCHYAEYFHSDNLMLHHVLRKRRGMPVSIGAIVLYLAASLNIPLFPVNFPTQLIMRAETVDESGRPMVCFFNPWDGAELSYEQLRKWLEAEMGYAAEINRDFLRRAESHELQERLETVVKMSLTREGRYEDALKLIEFRLGFSPDDPYEIRDRGMVLASMDCFQAAVDDLTYFIDQCPDDPSAAMLKLEMPSLIKQCKSQRIH